MAEAAANRRVVDMLREVVSRFSEVRLAYLFGSYAMGRETPASDIDIAVLVESKDLSPFQLSRSS
ncbi:MAG: nucleotidyltransferase domain-containing protein [Sulfolobales archaeon]